MQAVKRSRFHKEREERGNEMSVTMSIIGILLAFFLMNFLVYKGLNGVITGVISAAVIIFFSGMPFTESMASGWGIIGMIMGNMAPILIFGGILAAVYTASNATTSLSRVILKPFGSNPNGNVRRIGTLGMLLLIRVVIGLSGIDNLAVMPFMVALVVAVFSGIDLPRKYVNCVLMFIGCVGTLIPGVPHQYVILLQAAMPEFNNSGNLIVRWLLLIIYIVVGILILNRLMEKDEKNQIHFDPGPLEVPDLKTEDKTPHWVITIIPALVVYLLYNFASMEAWVALMLGCIAAIILFYPYFKKPEGKKTRIGSVVNSINTGSFVVPLGIVAAMIVSMVMTGAPGFNVLVDGFSAIPIPAAFGLMLIAILLTGATGGATAAIPIVAAIALGKFIPNGMSVQTAGVIALWSTSVLDTLPNNLGIIMQAELTATPMKEGYPSIFKTTVVLTLAMCAVVCVVATIGLLG